MINLIKQMVRRLVRPLVTPLVARAQSLFQQLNARVTNLENGIVARFEVTNRQFDEINLRLDALRTTKPGDVANSERLRTEVDRLDGYLVYHTALIRRDIAKVERLVDTQLVYSAPRMDVLLMHAGLDIVVPASESGLIAFVIRHGTESIEPGVGAIIRGSLPVGGTAIDVGANIGLHTLAMAQNVGERGKVFAFEPNPKIARALQRTLNLNGFSGTTSLLQKAASDQTGSVRMYLSEHSPESSLFPLDTAHPVDVDAVTVDSIVPPGTVVDLIKIDVEGAEPLVYRGMQRVLSESPKIRLIMEWSSSHFARSGLDAESFFSLLSQDGFKAYRIDDSEPGNVTALTEPVSGLEAANLLFTRD